MRKRSGGFTLIELMIAVVIIGVLAAIALPAYDNYILRSNRTAGKTAVMRIAGLQENRFTDRKSYGNSFDDLDTSITAADTTTVYVKSDGSIVTSNGTDRTYALTMHPYSDAGMTNCAATGNLPAGTITQYILVLTAQNRQAKDTKCSKLCLSSQQTKAAAGGGTDCWTR